MAIPEHTTPHPRECERLAIVGSVLVAGRVDMPVPHTLVFDLGEVVVYILVVLVVVSPSICKFMFGLTREARALPALLDH